jgi:predicted glycosyl hydrolase (DUF1957 family)
MIRKKRDQKRRSHEKEVRGGRMEKGYLALVLHSHLPYVRHPEHDQFLEEDWLYEAITETYIPLINVFDGLVSDGIDFRITMSLTPTLISMLTDPLLQHRYLRHIGKLIELAENEIERTRTSRSSARLRICTGICLSMPARSSKKSTAAT